MADSNSRATSANGKSYDIDKDDIFGRNGGDLKPVSVGSSASSSSSGYLSNVLPPASVAPETRNNSPQSDLYQSLNMHRGNNGQFGHGQSASSGRKIQGSPPPRQNKDGATASNEPIECAYFGVNYGGRDFYASSSTEAPETNKNYNTNESSEFDDANIANRGEWWQGSLYY